MIKNSLYLKVYGERNSGTNFVTSLVKNNFAVTSMQNENRVGEHLASMGKGLSPGDYGRFCLEIMDIDCERVMQSDFGWKHGAPPEQAIGIAQHSAHTLFICVAKHPVSWLRSLLVRPYSPLERPPKNFSDFLRYEMPVSRRDNLGTVGRLGVVELWNLKNAAYARLPKIADRSIVIAYEEILRNPQAFLAKVGQYLLPSRSEFIWSLPSTKGDSLRFDDYRDKYDLSKIGEMASAEDLRFIEDRVDRDVMSAFDYRIGVFGPR